MNVVELLCGVADVAFACANERVVFDSVAEDVAEICDSVAVGCDAEDVAET